MGILRMILAIAVICEHSPGISKLWFSGRVAVIMFFMISGFYMSLIYLTRYSQHKNGIKLFFSNRALRLYPTYFVALIFATILGSGSPLIFSEYWHFPDLFIPLANIFIFGLDALLIIGWEGMMLGKGPSYLVLNPAWSLGCEVLFYLMVPLLAKRALAITVLIIGSVSVRVYFVVNGYSEYPFLFMFFPSILVYFLMGYLGFHIYNKVKDYEISKFIGAGGIIFFFAYIIYKAYIHGSIFMPFFDPFLDSVKGIILFAAFALFIPFLFLVSRDSKVDRFIGNLSFSMYLIHLPIAEKIHYLGKYLGDESLVVVVVLLTLFLSVCIYFAIEKPIETFRRKRVANAS